MNRRILVTDRLVTVLTALNLWAVGGGGVLISLAGRPVFGMLVIAAALVILALTLTGRLGRQREYTVANLVVVGIGIPILFIGLILLGAVIPPSMNLIWYAYMAILVILSGAAVLLAAKGARTTT